ncbi:MAG: GNAT family N-acetyltransferase, partial [Acidobacteria bacterium]|nr:GNAT family N-acetyltransferase [Acidobacteriota bacterium]
MEHAPELWEIVKDHLEGMFKWIPYRLGSLEDFERFSSRVLDEQRRGLSVPFATVERNSSRIAGITRFMNIDFPNRKVEIGSSWIAPPWQRTAVNTEAKYLMLRHAFESWKCLRVEFKTDALNQRSRQAILRLGAKQEGTLRKHMVSWDGRQRDSVFFSVLDTEWPAVKGGLEQRLAQNY